MSELTLIFVGLGIFFVVISIAGYIASRKKKPNSGGSGFTGGNGGNGGNGTPGNRPKDPVDTEQPGK